MHTNVLINKDLSDLSISNFWICDVQNNSEVFPQMSETLFSSIQAHCFASSDEHFNSVANCTFTALAFHKLLG